MVDYDRYRFDDNLDSLDFNSNKNASPVKMFNQSNYSSASPSRIGKTNNTYGSFSPSNRKSFNDDNRYSTGGETDTNKMTTPSTRQPKTPKRNIRIAELMTPGVSESEVNDNFHDFSTVMKKPPPVDFRTESNLGTSNHADRDLSDTPESMTSHKAMGNNVNPVRAASPLPARDNYRYGNNYERSRTTAYDQKQFKSGYHTSSGNEDFNKRENFNSASYGNFRAKDTLNQRSESPFTSRNYTINLQSSRFPHSNPDPAFIPDISGLNSLLSVSEDDFSSAKSKKALDGYKKLVNVPADPDGVAIEAAMKSFHRTLTQTQEENNRYANKIEELEKKNSRLSAKYDDLYKKYTQLEADHKNDKSSSSTQSDRLSKYMNQVSTFKDEIRQLEEKIIKKDKELEEANQRLLEQDEIILRQDSNKDQISHDSKAEIEAFKKEAEKYRKMASSMVSQLYEAEEEIKLLKQQTADPQPQWQSHPSVQAHFQPQSQSPYQFQQGANPDANNVQTQPISGNSGNGPSEVDILRENLEAVRKELAELKSARRSSPTQGQAGGTFQAPQAFSDFNVKPSTGIHTSVPSPQEPVPPTTQKEPDQYELELKDVAAKLDEIFNMLKGDKESAPSLNGQDVPENMPGADQESGNSIHVGQAEAVPLRRDTTSSTMEAENSNSQLKEILSQLSEYVRQHGLYSTNDNGSDASTILGSSRQQTTQKGNIQAGQPATRSRATTLVSPITNDADTQTTLRNSSKEYVYVPQNGDGSEEYFVIPVKKVAVSKTGQSFPDQDSQTKETLQAPLARSSARSNQPNISTPQAQSDPQLFRQSLPTDSQNVDPQARTQPDTKSNTKQWGRDVDEHHGPGVYMKCHACETPTKPARNDRNGSTRVDFQFSSPLAHDSAAEANLGASAHSRLYAQPQASGGHMLHSDTDLHNIRKTGYDWDDEPTPRPSTSAQKAFETVLSKIESDRNKLVDMYRELNSAYEETDPAFGKRKRHELAIQLHKLIDEIEGSSNQIYAMADIAHASPGTEFPSLFAKKSGGTEHVADRGAVNDASAKQGRGRPQRARVSGSTAGFVSTRQYPQHHFSKSDGDETSFENVSDGYFDSESDQTADYAGKYPWQT